ncbi:unnamed protein product [Peronospora farinosa]|uniref:Uncharacterized protein n=1 Tax=Peronospora farinosa TaxID=134698 RepID=A0AAV0UKK3_9STRA|nr:unnamed protein product [Peronospora farinosa]CAI5737366.1 unnamed protein product [Peronospora farinosa]
MVYSPSMYLVASAVAAVVLKMQQAAATSLDSDPFVPEQSTDYAIYLSKEVPTKTCEYKSVPDLTLPDLSTIPSIDALYPDLLSNQSAIPDAVYLKAGINVVISDYTDDLDAYTYATSGAVPNLVTQGSSIVPATMTDTKSPTDCATGWDKPITLNTDNSIVSGNMVEETTHVGRRLTENDNVQIVALEKYFHKKMVRILADLPTEASYKNTPWGGPYWAAYEDSINVNIFKTEYFPVSAKYATAFNLNVKDFMDKISKEEGIDQEFLGNTVKTPCSTQETCNKLKDGSVCSKRKGQNSGYCFQMWWGMCNSWASAAILEPEPQCVVKYNNVSFRPIEIKALLTYVYERAQVDHVAAGARCSNLKEEKDEFGRSTSPCFNDMNPGFVHIAIANIIGLLGKTFIVDVEPGLPVWNHPLRGYKVLEQTKMSLEDAARNFYGRKQYPWNANAKSIVYMKTRVTWITEAKDDGPLVSTGAIDKFTKGNVLSYLLEMDDHGTIIGGEWLHKSLTDHPDFMWFPTRKPADKFVLKNGMRYDNVIKLLKKSVACSDTQ